MAVSTAVISLLLLMCTGLHLVTCQEETPECSGTLTDVSGQILSQNYPDNYTNYQNCVWRINVPDGQQVLLNVESFDLEQSHTCSYDYLDVRDGGETYSTLIGRYCGTDIPQVITSTGNQLTVVFRSDMSNIGAGFSIAWSSREAVCGGLLDESTGVIRLPESSNSQPLNCFWRIVATYDNKILLDITELELLENENCAEEYLDIYDCGFESTTKIHRVCGSSIPPLITAAENLCLILKTSSAVMDRRLRMAWDGTKPECGLEFQEQKGMLNSIKYPNSYPDNRDCAWNLTAAAGKQILLEVHDFALESSENCTRDYVEFRDGVDDSSDLIGRYCAENIPRYLTSTGNQVRVRFVTDYTSNHKGFNITWDGTRSVCGGQLHEETGLISFPLSEVHDSVNCVWNLEAIKGNKITLRINDFNLQDSADCTDEYLEIVEGGNFDSPLIGRFCGSSIPNVITAFEHQMSLRLVTKAFNVYSRFNVNWDSTTKVCGDISDGTIRSPRYPQNYKPNLECGWRIDVPEGRQILLNITDFKTENTTECRLDFLAIRDGGDVNSTMIGRYCGESYPEMIVSPSNQLFLEFRTDVTLNDRGFNIHWTEQEHECGGKLTSETGVISYPTSTSGRNEDQNCIWRIEAPPKNIITYNFTEFELEDSCAEEYLEIYDCYQNRMDLIGRYCGSYLPPANTSNTNNLCMILKTSSSVMDRRFTVSWDGSKLGCGGQFNSVSGEIISLNYPEVYPNNKDCEWLVTVNPENQILLEIIDAEVEFSGSCGNDYLEVHHGNDVSSPVIGRFCGSEFPRYIRSTGNQLRLHFVSDYSVVRKGFKITWDEVKPECGGTLQEESGVLSNYQQNALAPQAEDCVWKLEAPEGNKIQLNVTEFKLQDSVNCTDEFLEISDGDLIGSPIIGRFCGTSTFTTITTNHNKAWVRLVTGSSSSDSGFTMSWDLTRPECGSELRESKGLIQSKNYPDYYPNSYNCTWVVRASPGQRVLLEATEFDLESSEDCKFDYLMVSNGDDFNSTLLGQYCGETFPEEIWSHGNEVYLKFVTDESTSRKGFSIKYEVQAAATEN